MNTLRALIRDNRRVAIILILATLFVKALVPAGYMVSGNFKVLTISICSDSSGSQLTHQLVLPMKDSSGNPASEHAKGDGSCAFTSLGFGALAATDVVLLAAALAFILALGLAPYVIPRPVGISRLRPPLRGPPELI